MDGRSNFFKLHPHFFYQSDLIVNRLFGMEIAEFKFNVVQERSFGEFMANTVSCLGDKAHDRPPCSFMHINHNIVSIGEKPVIKPNLMQPGLFFKR